MMHVDCSKSCYYGEGAKVKYFDMVPSGGEMCRKTFDGKY